MNAKAIAVAVGLGVLAVLSVGTAEGTLVFEYNASRDPDGGTDNKWEPNINTSAYTRNWTLQNFGSESTFVADAGSAYPYLGSSYKFSRTNSGGSTSTFGRNDLPLGGTKNNNAGASAAFELWVKPNRSSLDNIVNETLFESGGTTSGINIGFLAASGSNSGARITFRTRKGGSSSNSIVTKAITDESLLDDFMQIVGVVDPDGGTKQSRLYLNRELLGSNTSFKKWQDGNTGAGLGRVNGKLGGAGSGGRFKGEIAILRLYDEPLTDAQVMSRWVGVTTPEPVTIVAVCLSVAGLGGYIRKRRRA